jgi:branched-chain amino acid transport system ATP-binding protein
MLKLNNIEVIYDQVILVLKGVSLEVPEGCIVALLGANGAGKSTTLKAISGLLRPERGEVTEGTIEFMGECLERMDAAQIVRRVFEHLTTAENLLTGAHTRTDSAALAGDIDLVYSYFPRLAERRTLKAGYLSGGEQQMLAIGRALMARPKLILLDEPSLGLAPLLVHEIFDIIGRLNRDEHVTILLVEQNAAAALRIADYGYVMENGRIVLDADAERLRTNEDVREFYLGLTEVGQRKSYRDVKHYRRRKRWLS